MPIRPKKEIIRRTGGEGITGPQLENLIHGYAFFEEPFRDDEARRKCWRKNRNYIMSLMGKPVQGEAFSLNHGAYFKFGTRPEGWWSYNAPGPRLFISCENDFCEFFPECQVAKNVPIEGPGCVIREGEDRKGKSSYCGLFKIECVSHDFKIYTPTQETEADFLRRYDLLTEEEKERLEIPGMSEQKQFNP